MLLPEKNKKCSECNNHLNYKDEKFCIHYSCDNCGFETLEWNREGCCNDPILKPRKFYTSDEEFFIDKNNYRIFNQCQNCGKKVGTALKRTDYPDAPFFDKDLDEKGQNERINVKNLANEIEARRKNRSRNNFEQDYQEYLKSDRWKKIREIVFERDHYVCQSCLSEKATEVHHTQGHFRFNEPLFSLVSVCSDCHRKITEMEQSMKRGETDLIKYKFDKDQNKHLS